MCSNKLGLPLVAPSFLIKSAQRIVNGVWSNRPYRQKIAIATWVALIPFSLLASVIALLDGMDTVAGRVRQQELWDAAEIRSSLDGWEKSHSDYLQVFAENLTLRPLQGKVASSILREANQAFPAFSFVLLDEDGRLLAQSGQNAMNLTAGNLNALIASSQAATSAKSSSRYQTQVLNPPYVAKPCLATSVSLTKASFSSTTHGSLISCVLLEDLAWASKASLLVKSSSRGTRSIPVIDLDVGRRRGWAALLVYSSGAFIELDPSQRSSEQMAHLDSAQVKKSAWGPIIKLALSSQSTTSLQRVAVDGTRYLVAINRQKPGHAIVVMFDERTVFEPLYRFFLFTVVGQLVAVGLGTGVLLVICGGLSRPIDRAGEKLLEISHGEFGESLPEKDNDIGKLYRYINQASAQFQHFLEEERGHAMLDSQLSEARRIQQTFIVKQLPQSPAMELAAAFQPAYQIGADWYDAFAVDQMIFLVVADVCDKGVPSALYMSVFRSLLRNSLQQEWAASDADPETTLLKGLEKVNAYMQHNHGDTDMFATVFVAAFKPGAQLLHYVVAGHDQPFLLTQTTIETLELGGPAVGVLEAAQFTVKTAQFLPGSILLAFTDGLPDTRNREGVGFGFERIRSILLERSSADWSAADLVCRYQQATQAYMDGADQFDDLTLLALKALPQSFSL